MHNSMLLKLEKLKERLDEIQNALLDSDTVKDIEKYTQLNKEFSELRPIVEKFDEYNETIIRYEGATSLLESEDDEIKELAQIELEESQQESETFERDLKFMLLPKDSADDGSAYLEIRAGAGGDEAGIFAGDLFRMYTRLAEREGWGIEIINTRPAEQGGLKEAVAKLTGKAVFKVMKFESGVHRVQRVPETESQGRVHTSAITVAVLPEAEEVDIDLNMADVRRDTYRASGAGGQHVNKTESAIRLTHIPTNIVVECQDGRSQHKNYDKALKVLRSRLYQAELEKKQEERAEKRKSLVSSGDRSAKIRTYNYPQGRITDHRINKTMYNLSSFINGDIQEMIDALKVAENAEKMKGEEGLV